MNAPRIAIVHERFTELGGSETCVAQFFENWPRAEVFAPIVELDSVRPPLHTVHDTWLSKAHSVLGSHAPLLPFIPRALRKLPLRNRFDAVLISHFAFATQAVFATDAPTIAYVHSPARWAWDPAFRAQEAGGRMGQAALSILGEFARRNELRAALHLDHVVANSRAVAERIHDWWGLPASVVNPPVHVDRFTPDPALPPGDFFLCAGRLVPYKRADLAIRAAQRAGVRLVVLGDGRFRSHLESIAGQETVFLGATPFEVLLDAYRRAQAVLMPGIEDFGIVPVEAMACGTPVIAVGAGGALDSVLPGVTGELIPPGTDEAVIEALAKSLAGFARDDYCPDIVREHAITFSPTAFRHRIATTVDEVLGG
ncbi:glycosyltransferase [Nocardia sp. NPDC127579]|uniref:glycosyltransferase n=1 Tax=Nocardia sp. NPDC127579 TaxID=3345402 RepID=UPI0036439434